MKRMWVKLVPTGCKNSYLVMEVPQGEGELMVVYDKPLQGYPVQHGEHGHRSKEERHVCNYLRSKYGEENVQVNVKGLSVLSRPLEIDFAILDGGKVKQFVEYHPMWREKDPVRYIARREELVRVLFGAIPLTVLESVPKPAARLRKVSRPEAPSEGQGRSPQG